MMHVEEDVPYGENFHNDVEAVAWANAAVIGALGFARLDEIVGRHLLDFLPAEDRPAVADAMAKAMPNQVSEVRLTYRVQRPDGTHRFLEAGTAQMVEYEGLPARVSARVGGTPVAGSAASVGSIAWTLKFSSPPAS
jgi:PAS domain S-box-containing protein